MNQDHLNQIEELLYEKVDCIRHRFYTVYDLCFAIDIEELPYHIECIQIRKKWYKEVEYTIIEFTVSGLISNSTVKIYLDMWGEKAPPKIQYLAAMGVF